MLIISPYRLGAVQTVSFTGTAASLLNALGSGTQAFLCTATQDCHIRVGKNPTAVSTDTLIKAGVPYVFGINAQETVSVIQDSTGGTLYFTELSH